MIADAQGAYERREEEFGSEVMREVERRVVLSVLDRKWREHLYEMDYLREGIGLRGYGQRDPLIEYQREGYDMFGAMMDGIKEESVGHLFNLQVQVQENPIVEERRPRRRRFLRRVPGHPGGRQRPQRLAAPRPAAAGGRARGGRPGCPRARGPRCRAAPAARTRAASRTPRTGPRLPGGTAAPAAARDSRPGATGGPAAEPTPGGPAASRGAERPGRAERPDSGRVRPAPAAAAAVLGPVRRRRDARGNQPGPRRERRVRASRTERPVPVRFGPEVQALPRRPPLPRRRHLIPASGRT